MQLSVFYCTFDRLRLVFRVSEHRYQCRPVGEFVESGKSVNEVEANVLQSLRNRTSPNVCTGLSLGAEFILVWLETRPLGVIKRFYPFCQRYLIVFFVVEDNHLALGTK